jgi:MFS transporter, MHS family, shikimate and dehydroshikimate transport protein
MGVMAKVVSAATVGTVIEWYDFFVYLPAAALVFNKLFFPQADPLTGTLLAFGTSATGFLARPLGAVVAGHYGDRIGRKALLIASLAIMGGATFLIGLLPTYASAGIMAPVLLLVLRVVQGFATGGEWGGAALMVVESSPSRRRNIWGSFITVGILLGLVLASTAFTAVNGVVSDNAFLTWGWRVPFLLSALLVAVGLYIRLNVGESKEFEDMVKSGKTAAVPLIEALMYPRHILTIFFIRIAENFSFYTFAAFSLSYVSAVLGLPRSLALNGVIVAALAECVTAVLFGALADRIGSRKVMLSGLGFQAVFAFPFFWLMETKAPGLVMLAIALGFACANGAISAVQPDYFAGFFGANIRYSGISIGREGATIIGGGLSPVIATALVTSTGASWPVALCMMFTSVIGFAVVLFARRAEDKAVGASIDQNQPDANRALPKRPR